MPKKLRILFVASEMAPLAKTGGLADVVGTLPAALARLGHDVRIVLPKYRHTWRVPQKQKRVVEVLGARVGWETQWCSVDRSYVLPNVTTYLLEHNVFFDRDSLYGYHDDWQRFAFLCRAALETCRTLNWKPHVIHCHDWQAGLIAPFLRTFYAGDPVFQQTGVLFTIHNLYYRGTFHESVLPRLHLRWEMFKQEGLEYYGEVSFIKGGIAYADVLNAVSPTYAHEIQTERYGEGLHGLLSARRDRLFGVLNGIDYNYWNPSTDPHLAARFDLDSIERKEDNKQALRHDLGLPQYDGTALIGVVSRLTEQKGFHLVEAMCNPLLERPVQLVVLGSGDPRFDRLFGGLQWWKPDRVAARLGVFDEGLAHRIYAASDMFLMPSAFEPCGLGQMIALAYGTIPLVHRTGGLVDTITDYGDGSNNGNGFEFWDYSPHALLATVDRALHVYHRPDRWHALRKNAMSCDFSWTKSAKEYEGLYRKAMEWRAHR